MTSALSAAQLSTLGRGRNTRLRTYLTPVSTEPFSQPFAGAQYSARNGYAPRNAANASVSARSRPASTCLTASDVLSRTTRSTTPPKYVNADSIPSSSDSSRSSGYALAKIHVAGGQRRHQILDLARHPGDVGPRFAEVDLHRRAGKHATVHEGLLRRRGRSQRRHIPAHRARGDRSGQRQQQPTNPLRRQPPVLAEPLRNLLPPLGPGRGRAAATPAPARPAGLRRGAPS